MNILFEIFICLIVTLFGLGSVLISWGVQQEKVKRRKRGDWMWPYIVTSDEKNNTKQKD